MFLRKVRTENCVVHELLVCMWPTDLSFYVHVVDATCLSCRKQKLLGTDEVCKNIRKGRPLMRDMKLLGEEREICWSDKKAIDFSNIDF
jgi:hypothetical protein